MDLTDFQLRMQRLRGAKIECGECGLHIEGKPEDYISKRIHPGCRPLGRCYGCDKVVRKGEGYCVLTTAMDWGHSGVDLDLEPGQVMVHRHPHDEDKPHPTCAQRAQEKVLARKAALEKERRKRQHKEDRRNLLKEMRADAKRGLKVLVLCPRGQVRDASAGIRADKLATVASNQHGLVSVSFHDSSGTVTFVPNDIHRSGADKVFVLYDPHMSDRKLGAIRSRYTTEEVVVEDGPWSEEL